MDASVVICTHNRCERLRLALNSLLAMEVPQAFAWEILVIDNNSTDLTRQVVEEAGQRRTHSVRYLFERRQGKSQALNAAIEAAEGQILVFTDDDVVVDSRWLIELVGTLNRFDCRVVGGRVVADWGSLKRPRWLRGAGCRRRLKVIVAFEAASECVPLDVTPIGANFAVRREVFDRYGLFRTDLGPTKGSEIRYEDTEFLGRVLSAGERIMYTPDAVVFHPVTEDRIKKSYFRKYYFAYGRAVVIKHGIPGESFCLGGVPRYLLRDLGTNLVRWLVSHTAARRFHYQLECCRALGSISAARHGRQRRRALAQAQPFHPDPADKSVGRSMSASVTEAASGSLEGSRGAHHTPWR